MNNEKIFTIGYEGIDFDTFISKLKVNNIDTLVDVRQMPVSRKKGFSKKRLAEWLAEEGIGYEHYVRLGCPRTIRDQYRVDKNWQRYETDYVDFLQSERGDEVNSLSVLAKSKRCALMCFEADFTFCHRSLITRQMVADYGFSEQHIGLIKTSLAA